MSTKTVLPIKLLDLAGWILGRRRKSNQEKVNLTVINFGDINITIVDSGKN